MGRFSFLSGILWLSALVGVQAAEARRPEDYYQQGLAEFQRGAYSAALADLTKAIQGNPQVAVYYEARGDSFFHLCQPEAAIADYTIVAGLNPQSPAVLEKRANCRRLTGDLEGAIADFNAVLLQDPNNRPARIHRGLAWRAAGELNNALADFSAVLVVEPSPENYMQRGFVARDQGDWPAAAGDFTRVIQQQPTSAQAYLNRGLVLQQLGRLTPSQTDFDQYLALKPGMASALERVQRPITWKQLTAVPVTAHAFFDRGSARHMLGDRWGAIADFTQALQRDPQLPDALILRGLAWETNLRHWALADYSRAIALDPANVLACQDRGIILRDLGRFDDAIADFQRALAIRPRDAWTQFYLATAWKAKGDPARALIAANTAIELDARVPDFYEERALIAIDQGDLDRAIADSTAALTIDPRMASTYNDRGYAFLRKGALAEAIADLTQAIQLDPTLKPAYRNRAQALSQQRNLAAAVADDTRLLELDPRDAEVFFQRGLRRLALGQWLGADNDFAHAVSLRPELREQVNKEIKKVRSGTQVVSSFRPIAPTAGSSAPASRNTVSIPPPPSPGPATSTTPAAATVPAQPAPTVLPTPPGAAPSGTPRVTKPTAPLPPAEQKTLVGRELLTRANTLAMYGDRQGAAAIYTRFIALNPTDAEAYLRRGLLFLQLGKQAEAQQDFAQFLALKPDAKARLESEIRTLRAGR